MGGSKQSYPYVSFLTRVLCRGRSCCGSWLSIHVLVFHGKCCINAFVDSVFSQFQDGDVLKPSQTACLASSEKAMYLYLHLQRVWPVLRAKEKGKVCIVSMCWRSLYICHKFTLCKSDKAKSIILFNLPPTGGGMGFAYASRLLVTLFQ